MIVCQECGNAAPSNDGFCSSCGVLLEWSGEKIEPAGSPGGPPPDGWSAPRVWPTPSGPPQQWGAPGSAAPPVPPPPGWNPPGPYQGGPYPPGPYPGGPYPGPPQGYAAPGPGGPYGYGAPTPQPYQPGPQLPGTEASQQPRALKPDSEVVRPSPVPIVETTEYGGLFCSSCGTRNADGRTFCRFCGTPLGVSVTTAPPRRRWWQRLFGTRTKAAPTAGERPKEFTRRELNPTTGRAVGAKPRRRPRLKLSKIAPILVVLGLIGFGLGPGRQWITTQVDNLVGKAKHHVSQKLVPVSPVSATALTAVPTHPAKLVIDGVAGTWWQSTDTKDGVGQSLTITFANPVNIDRIGIRSGVPAPNFLTEARVRTMAVTADGKAVNQISFTDSGDFQSTSVSLRGVTSLTFVIVASYPGQAGHAVAISEIEFDQNQ